jgi:thiol-disulfide isomerase/thioredoxin
LCDTTSSTRRRRTSKKRYIGIGTAIGIIAVVVVSIFTGGHVTTGNGEPTSNLVGKSVAPFSLSGLKSGTIVAPWKSHHAAVLIFFASWCEPCQGEMPKVAAYLRHHNQGSIHIVGIDANDERGAATTFVNKSGVTFPVAFDANGVVTAQSFKFLTLPETAFVRANGIVNQVYFGAIPKKVLVEDIAALRRT